MYYTEHIHIIERLIDIFHTKLDFIYTDKLCSFKSDFNEKMALQNMKIHAIKQNLNNFLQKIIKV